jgi:predicted dehydrogenase
MAERITRRRFLKAGAAMAGAIGFPAVLPQKILGANEKLQIAGIGAGGKGEVDVGYCSGEAIVCLCDVDEQNAGNTFAKFPSAKKYKDYRKMLEAEEKRIDAVTVSTPDHVHAPASIMAMKMGKHVYCQKPLTHSIFEARRMAEVARDKKVATQMGNQGYAHPGTRRLVEIIQAGALGKVREAHVWTDRPIWPQGIDRPGDSPSVPPTLAWDLWLGPAPERPYHPAYVPFKWRGWWDFGTGALGDMGCHNMGLPFFALGLRDPLSAEASFSGRNDETAPAWSIITYEFPALGSRPPVRLTWYDGKKKPSRDLVKGQELPSNGVILIGDKDTLFVPSYWGGGAFLSGAKLEDFKSIPETLPRLSGAEEDNDRAHHLEWIQACKGGPRAQSSFDHSGPMTEAVLLGNVALRAGRKIEWDATSLTVTNAPEANKYIRREYRKGWGEG